MGWIGGGEDEMGWLGVEGEFEFEFEFGFS